MSLCGIADKHAMKLRSSSLQGKSTSVQSEQGKSKYGIISDISARTVVISKSESETNSSTSNVQSTPSLFRPESAKRYNLRSRPEVLSTPLPKYRAASSKLNVQKRITRQKGVRASPTNGPRTCPICVESKTRRQYIVLERIPKCSHEISACKVCALRHINTELERYGRWDEVSCLDCKEPLGRSFISKMLNKTDMKRMKAIVTRKSAEKNPRYRCCISTHCTAGQIHPQKALTDMVVCYRCQTKSCFHHGISWHNGYDCASYSHSHPAVPVLWTSEVRFKAQAKKCPGPGCEYYVEKDGGCQMMRCSMCKHHWQWNKVKYGIQKLPEKEEVSAS